MGTVAVDSNLWIDLQLFKFSYIKMLKVVSLLVLVGLCTPFPQWTEQQLIAIRQHEAIAAEYAPSPIAEVPGYDTYLANNNAVLRLQGVDPGLAALNAANARVLAQQAELANTQ